MDWRKVGLTSEFDLNINFKLMEEMFTRWYCQWGGIHSMETLKRALKLILFTISKMIFMAQNLL